VFDIRQHVAKIKSTPLAFEDVENIVKHIPEEALKQYLATIPQFYQHQSTIFKDLGKSKVYFRKSCWDRLN
jgi:hypothetical protein